MNTDLVLTEVQDRVMTIRMNRPAKKNALNSEMYQGLAAAFTEAERNPDVRVVILTGTADSFSSGNDIADFINKPNQPGSSVIADFMKSVIGCGKPVIAAVQGLAIGIGTTVLMHADLIYASDKARFQMPFVNIGICPEFGGNLVLPSLMGHARAAELLLLGEMFSPDKAREYGLVNEVLPDEQVQARARQQALKLAAQPPNALRATKRLLKRWTQQQLEEVIAEEIRQFSAMLTMPEAREALTAFVQKRKPDFSQFN